MEQTGSGKETSDLSSSDPAVLLFEELMRTREEKGRLQDYLDRIFGISSAIIYILDANGHFTFVNRGVEEILNFSTEELIGKHFSFILPPDEYERVSREVVLPRIAGQVTGLESAPKLFNERRTGIRRTRNMEVKLMTRRQNDYRVMAGNVTGIVEVEGAYSLSDESISADDKKDDIFLGSQGVIFDITKYKKAEYERLELHKRLFQIQKSDAMGKFAGKVAHDLNNKLGSIIGTAEILKQELFTSEPGAALNVYLDTLLSASRRAAELSNRLSEFSRRGDSGFIKVNFHELLDGVMDLARSVASGDVSIHKILRSKNPSIMGSHTMLQNAMLNLITNAFEAMSASGGVLTVETSDVTAATAADDSPKNLLRRGHYLLVSVRDTGVGMNEDVKARLFDPFFTTKQESGLGLGLLSLKECVRSHGGIIDIHSSPGKGARFDIYLPRVGE